MKPYALFIFILMFCVVCPACAESELSATSLTSAVSVQATEGKGTATTAHSASTSVSSIASSTELTSLAIENPPYPEDAAERMREHLMRETGLVDIQSAKMIELPVESYRFADSPNSLCKELYFFVRQPYQDVFGTPAGFGGVWVYHAATDTLITIAEGDLLAVKMPDAQNVYVLQADSAGVHGQYVSVPRLMHYQIAFSLENGQFSCVVQAEEQPYTPPICEDIYVIGEGIPVEVADNEPHSRIVVVDGDFEGITLLVDFNGTAYTTAPELSAAFCYDDAEHLLTLTMSANSSLADGDVDISNLYIKSAEWKTLDAYKVQLVLSLTEYARYYTVEKSVVFNPTPQAMCGSYIDPQTQQSVDYDFYEQCYYETVSVRFGIGEYAASGMDPSKYNRAEPYYTYADPMTWQSAWEVIDAVWAPLDLREDMVPYVRATQENWYQWTQTLKDWPQPPSAQF